MCCTWDIVNNKDKLVNVNKVNTVERDVGQIHHNHINVTDNESIVDYKLDHVTKM